MNSLLTFEWLFSEAVVERLGWVLVHSLWQFSLMALLVGVTVRALRRSSSSLRYGVLVVAMAVSVAAPTATWMLMPNDIPDDSASQRASVFGQDLNAGDSPMAETTPLANNPVFADDGVIEGPPPDPAPSSVASEPQPAPSPISAGNTQPAPSWSVRAQTFLRPWLAWIVIGWSLGVVLCSARPLLGWHTLRRLRQTGISPVSNEVLAVLHHVSERLGLHCAVRLLQSTLTQVPVVVGYFRPVILLPVSLMTSIPAAQLEAILAHELAHVKRHDFVVNLLQMLVETLFFYHPAVWWLSHRIRVEREHCCDDLVVKLFDNRLEYGRALIAIEQLRGQNSVLALAATDGSLLARIRRLVGLNSQGNVSSPVERWPAAILSMALIGIIFLLTLNWSLSAKDEIQNSAGPDEKTNPERHQDWVTFENVAMQLGQETDVKVPVETEPREQPRAEQEAATVVGAVVSPDGKPVAGIEVLAFQGGKRLEQKFTTDERGEFRVPKAWREVDHWLTAVARDGRERLGWFDFMIHRHSIIGQNPEDGSFRLVLLPMSRTIRGRVLDESGQPLAQIPVRINQLDHEVNSTSVHWSFQKLGDEALVFGAVTDNDGRFELKLPASTFAWLGTSHPDWVESRIRVTKENDQVGDTKLVRAAKVAGRVIDSRTGKTLAGVTIAAHATKTEILESGGDEAKTDADGKFLIQGLRSGEYTIQLVKSPFRTLTAPALTGAVLKPGETFKADFALNFGKRLTGRVLDMDTGEPIPDCKVNCTSPAQPNGGLSMETNAQGEFEFIIPPGQSRLSSTEGRRFGNESTREVDVLADGDPEPVVLKVGPKIEPIPGDFKIFIGPPLDRKVSLHFQRTPLVEVLEHACQATAVKLELDGEGLKSVGYTKNMAVTIDADNVTLRDALTQLLKPHEKLSFTLDNNQLFISTRQQVEAREKQAAEPKGPTEEKKAGATSPPVGLEFLKPYPKLHGLSLDMTERQFLEIVKQQELKTRKTVDGDKVQYHIPLSDGHTLIVMFEKDAKCSGIQRVRGDERGEQSQVEHGSKSRLMTLLPGGRMIELVGVAHASLVTPSGTKRKVEGWWKADGTQLDKEPFTLSPLSVAANRQHFCEFAIRLQTRPKELATPEKLLLPPMHEPCGLARIRNCDATRRLGIPTASCSTSFWSASKTRSPARSASITRTL